MFLKSIYMLCFHYGLFGTSMWEQGWYYLVLLCENKADIIWYFYVRSRLILFGTSMWDQGWYYLVLLCENKADLKRKLFPVSWRRLFVGIRDMVYKETSGQHKNLHYDFFAMFKKNSSYLRIFSYFLKGLTLHLKIDVEDMPPFQWEVK